MEGRLGTLSTAVLRGEEVVIEGWLDDVRPGRLSEDGFIMTVHGKDHRSDPIARGRTGISFKGPMGESRLEFRSANCSSRQVGLGAAHLTALRVQQWHDQLFKPKSEPQRPSYGAPHPSVDPMR